MPPCQTSWLLGCLRRPAEAFGYCRSRGAGKAVCWWKLLGSLAAVALCRGREAAARRSGADGWLAVIVYAPGRQALGANAC
jgi:hypothetical protein